MNNNNYHNQTVEQVLSIFKTSEKGLSQEDSLRRQKEYGKNEIPEKKSKNPIYLFLHQFKSVLIYILFAAAIISYFLDHKIDTYIIAIVILVNSIAGFILEFKAEKAIQALKKNLVSKAQVLRGGQQFEIMTSELVPGDIVVIEEGDKIPADGRIIKSKNFRAIESVLTGEAFSVEKNEKILPLKISQGDKSNMVWMGTFCVSGNCLFLVTGTGVNTAIGAIAQGIDKIKKGKSHFERKTDFLSKQMGIIAIIGSTVIFLIGVLKYKIPLGELFIFSSASLVSAIPEGLPAVLIIVLAVGASRMARKKAIIKSLPATETLSVTDIISTDKTGTLTQNTMTIKEIVLPSKHIFVTGSGWTPKGSFLLEDKIIKIDKYYDLKKIIQAAVLCSKATLIVLNKNKNYYEVKGDPTEGAMTVLGIKAGIRKSDKSFDIIDETPFDQNLKYKKVTLIFGKKKEMFLSGAPEKVLALCTKQLVDDRIVEIKQSDRQNILDQINNLSQKAMRIIGLACKDHDHEKDEKMTFIGLLAMSDPPRIGVKDAISKAKLAGIRIIMKTGDFKGTAIAIAKEVGIIDPQKQNPHYPEALTGEELFSLSQEEFEEMVENVSVFARLTPKMKLDILETLQKRGHCVAMTGDGVNDALALKKADIGISMGLRGTDVARESSDIVLADDNFASLIDAIEEGRVVYKNTMQTSSFLVTTNFAEHAIIIISMLFGLPLPLTASQILWLNLVTDGVSNIPLALEPSHGDVLFHPPRKKEENILSPKMIPFMITIVSTMILLSFYVYLFLLPQGLEKARTGAFTIMAMCQVFNILNMRSLDKSIFKIGIFSNKNIIYAFVISLFLQTLVIYHPFLQKIFKFDYINYQDYLVIIFLSSFILWVGEFYKIIVNRNTSKVALPSFVV